MLRDLGTDVQWVHSYVVDDKLFCVYNATGPDSGSFDLDGNVIRFTGLEPTTLSAGGASAGWPSARARSGW